MSRRKTTLFTWDKKAQRWRCNGRYCKPPTRKQLRQNRNRKPIDARGKLVPKSAIAPEPKSKKKRAKKPQKPKKKHVALPPKKKAPPKKPKLRLVPPVERAPSRPHREKLVPAEHVRLGDFAGGEIEYHSTYNLAEFEVRTVVDMLDLQDDSYINRILAKGDTEAEFVHVNRQGLHIRPDFGMLTPELIHELRVLATKLPGGRLQIVTEGAHHHSVRITMAVNTSLDNASMVFERAGGIFAEAFKLMDRSFPWLSWDYFFETDEEIYEDRKAA